MDAMKELLLVLLLEKAKRKRKHSEREERTVVAIMGPGVRGCRLREGKPTDIGLRMNISRWILVLWDSDLY